MMRPEQALQQSVARYLAAAHPKLIWFHVPNGGGRSPTEAGILKSMGVKAGVPDLVFVLPGAKAAFIELKAGKGALSASQMAFRAECIMQGVPYAECRSLSEVEGTLAGWGETGRGRVSA